MKKYLFCIAIILFSIFFFMPVNGSEISIVPGMRLEQIDDAEEYRYFEDWNVQFYDIEPESSGIIYFSLDQSSGDIAIVTKNGGYGIAAIYSNSMTFKMSIKYRWINVDIIELYNGFLNFYSIRFNTQRVYSINIATREKRVYDPNEDHNEYIHQRSSFKRSAVYLIVSSIFRKFHFNYSVAGS